MKVQLYYRYVIVSLLSAAIDIGLFTYLAAVPVPGLKMNLFTAAIMARLLSGVCNFLLNRNWVFQSDRSIRKQAAGYGAVFCFQMMFSALLVSSFSYLPVPPTVVKLLVDGILFLFSYIIQSYFIFKKV